MMDKAGFLDRPGREKVCADIDLALAFARELLHLPTVSPDAHPQKSQPCEDQDSPANKDNLAIAF
jgi:hypothetical protein